MFAGYHLFKKGGWWSWKDPI